MKKKENASESECEDVYVYTLSSLTSHSWPDTTFINLSFGPKQIQTDVKIDTGSQVNILTMLQFKQISLKTPLLPPDSKLISDFSSR